jgi:sugar phosphate isomerase/epimerase
MRREAFLKLGMTAAAMPWLVSCSSDAETFAALSVGTFSRGLIPEMEQSGYGHLELSVTEDLMPARPEEDFEKHLVVLKKLKIRCHQMNNFINPSIKMVGPDVAVDKIVSWAKTTFARAERAGVNYITIGAGKPRKVPEGFEPAKARAQLSAIFARILPMANDHGVTLAMENLNSGETNLGNTLLECLEIVEVAGPKMKLTADIFHMMREKESPASLMKAASRLTHCHIAEREKRTPPGTAGDDFRPYLHELRAMKYRGAFSFECGWGEGRASLARAISVFREQLRTC